MIIEKRTTTYRCVISILANLVVVLLCAALWGEVVRDLPVRQEQIITNETSFTLSLDRIYGYSWSIDVPNDLEDLTVVIQDSVGNSLLTEAVHVDDPDDIGVFAPMTMLTDPIDVGEGNLYTACIYDEDGNLHTDRVSVALYGQEASLVEWFAAVCVLVLLITNLALVIAFRASELSGKQRGLLLIAVMLLIGVLCNAAYRPLNVPDEQDHYAVTYNLSAVIYRLVPDQRETLFMQPGIWQSKENLPTGQQIYSFWYDTSYGNDPCYQETTHYFGIANYPRYGYIPGSLAVAICRLVQAPYQMLLIAGRMANYIAFLLLMVICNQVAPDLRMAIWAIAALPSTVWLAASYSYDGWNLGFSMLFICYMWRITTYRKNVGIRELIGFALLLVAFAPIKYIYVILALLIFAIPLDHWQNLKGIVAGVIIAFIGLVIAMRSRLQEVIQLLMTSTSDTRGLEQGLSGESYTVSYVIRHPLQVILTFAKTFYTDAETMIERLLVGEFHSGYVPGYLTMVLGILFVILMLYSTRESLPKRDRINHSKIAIWVYRLVFVLGIFAVYGSFLFLYSYYNKDQIGVISGVQGRYFLPIILLLAPAGSARLADQSYIWLHKKGISREQILAAFLYVSLLVVLCRIPGFIK